MNTTPTQTDYLNLKNLTEREMKKNLLKSSYTKGKRVFEIFCSFSFLILFTGALYNIIINFSIWNIWALILGSIAAMLFADFMSGLVHWLADTWGTLETPIVGSNFIRSFREHHIDPVAMTRHDVFETNGDNALLTLLTLYMMCRKVIPSHQGVPDGWEYTQLCFWTFSCLWVALTNQIHKWAHTYKPPKFVVILQNCGIILSRRQHGIHHKPPFDRYYCITNGWMNKPLELIRFWSVLEFIISRLTGWKPREDDHKWTGLIPENPDVVQRALKQQQQQQQNNNN